VFLRSGIHLGASPPVCFATTSSRCVRLRRTALRACPQMNASTQPAEGAGRSKARSRAAGELTLGLLSGEERSVYAGLLWELACQRWRPASQPISSCYLTDRSLRSAWECSQGRSAFQWGGWIKIKSCRRATARPVEW
jgi:hypothetical protein